MTTMGRCSCNGIGHNRSGLVGFEAIGKLAAVDKAAD